MTNRTIKPRDASVLPLLAILLYPAAAGARGQDRPAHAQPATASFAPGAERSSSRRTVWSDLDHDGDQDLYVLTARRPDELLINMGDGTFVKLHGTALPESLSSRSISIVDFDRDGVVELVAVDWAGTPGLLGLEGREGRLQVATVNDQPELGLLRDCTEASWSDYDSDGWPDLEVHAANGDLTLFHNDRGRLQAVHLGLTPIEVESASGSRAEFTGAPLDQAVSTGSREAGDAQRTSVRPATQTDEPLTSVTTSSNRSAPPQQPAAMQGICATSVRDQASPGACLMASSTPTSGMLFPLGNELFVDSATGYVGIGSTNPDYELEIRDRVGFGEQGAWARMFVKTASPTSNPRLYVTPLRVNGTPADHVNLHGDLWFIDPARFEAGITFGDGTEQTTAWTGDGGGGGSVPAGTIVMWNGTSAPDGWAICDGGNGTPDLRARFVVGAGSGDGISFSVGNTGGSTAHTHTGTTEAEDLSIPAGDSAQVNVFENQSGTSNVSTSDHEHSVDNFSQNLEVNPTLPDEHLPPYYVLTFIMKVPEPESAHDKGL